MRVLVGHDPYYDTEDHTPGLDDGTDILLTIHDDDTIHVALRPGKGRTGWSWGPPVELTEVPS